MCLAIFHFRGNSDQKFASMPLMQKMRLVSLIFIFFTLAVHALEFGKKTLFNNLRSMNCILILVPLSSKTRYLGHSELNAEFSNSCEMIITLSPFCFKTSNFPTKRSLGARCWPPSRPRICRNRNEVGSEIFFQAGKIFEVRSYEAMISRNEKY